MSPAWAANRRRAAAGSARREGIAPLRGTLHPVPVLRIGPLARRREGTAPERGGPMTRKKLALVVLPALAVAAIVYFLVSSRPKPLVLTGLVTTNDVILSPQIAGQVERLLVSEGDSVKQGQLLAVIKPDELRADTAYYSQSAQGIAAQVQEGEAALRYQQRVTADQIQQAEASLAAADAQRAAAQADAENARLQFERNERLKGEGIVSQGDFDQSRTAYDAARARLESLGKQVEAQKAALALARSSAEQNSVKLHQLDSSRHEQAAADAQSAKADVRLAYTELRAPIEGIVDVRAVRPGEVVAAGQPVLTLINLDDLWVRADLEESYIDHVRLGDRMTLRLPSGEQRTGTVFYRAADAAFATQRDVSRSKRDIKTFEIRLRVDNKDRRLAVGMTVYVLFPVPP
jgi:HlyD family secretion protein